MTIIRNTIMIILNLKLLLKKKEMKLSMISIDLIIKMINNGNNKIIKTFSSLIPINSSQL